MLNSMRKHFIRSGLLLLGIMAFSLQVMAQGPTPTPSVPAGPTLAAVFARREVVCGVSQDLFGFGYLDPNTGDVSGFDVDFCRAIASAVLGDASLVSLPLYPDSAAGEDALHKGDIDILLHNVTWTLTDDAKDLTFGPVNFYGGQTAMVRGESSFNDWPDLDGKTICVVTGSSAETHLLPYMQSRGFTGNLLPVAALGDGQKALDDGRCDALSSDIVQLTILRQRATQQSYRVWQNSNQIYTHEPYAPVMRSGDDQWQTLVNWTILGLIQAEQLGVSSENVQSLLRQQKPTLETDADYIKRVGPDVAHFLDPILGLGGVLGVQPDFMRLVILQVGNYGEIYNRHLGPEGDLPIERGLNSLLKDGGLLYSPDWH